MMVMDPEIVHAPSPARLYDLMLPLRSGAILDAHLEPNGVVDGVGGFSHRASCRLTEHPVRPGPGADDGQRIDAPYWDLPFPPESFDCVVLHGVLDRRLHRAAEASHHDPMVALLRTVHRTLRPGGIVAASAHNLLCPYTRWDLRNRHATRRIDLPWPLAPRSYWGYTSLLQHSGFDQISGYAVLPSYDSPMQVISTSPLAARYFYGSTPLVGGGPLGLTKRIGRMLLNRFNVLPYLEQSFLILGHKC